MMQTVVALWTLLQLSIAASQHEFTVYTSWKSYSDPIVSIRFNLQLPSSSQPSVVNRVYFRMCMRDTSLTWTRCNNQSQASEQTPACQQIGNIALACKTLTSSCNIPLPTVQNWYMLQLQVETTASAWLPVCAPESEGLLKMSMPSSATIIQSTGVSSNKSMRSSSSDVSTINFEVWQIGLIAAGGVLLIVIAVLLLTCCGCFRRGKYTVSNRQTSELSRQKSFPSRSTVHSSRSSLTSKRTNRTGKQFWKHEESSVEIRPDIDIVPVYNNPLNDFVTGTTNRLVPVSNRNANKRLEVSPASGDIILHKTCKESSDKATFSSFVATNDYVIRGDAEGNPKSFSQVVGLGRQDAIGRYDAIATDLELQDTSQTLEDSVEEQTRESYVETSSMTTSL